MSVLRETIAWIAGLVGMSWPRFLFWNAFGGIVWASMVGLLAYFGAKALADTIGRYSLYAGVAIAGLTVVIVAGRKLVARRQSRLELQRLDAGEAADRKDSVHRPLLALR